MIRYIELPFNHLLDTSHCPTVRRKTFSQCAAFEIPSPGALLQWRQFGWTTRRLATLKTAQAAKPLATCPMGHCRTTDAKFARDLSFRQATFELSSLVQHLPETTNLKHYPFFDAEMLFLI
jgi:hypothetical protein